MKQDDFEQRLSHQTLRAVPEPWREGILAAAQADRSPQPPPAQIPQAGLLSALLRDWLWPHPVAWGFLAACWVAILGLHHASTPSKTELARDRETLRYAIAYSDLLSRPEVVELMGPSRGSPSDIHPPRRSPDVGSYYNRKPIILA